MRLSLSLASDETAPARARTSLRALSLGLSPHVLRDLQLIVSELVTNAVLEGPREGIRIEIDLEGRNRLRGEIIDQGAAGEPFAPPLDGNSHDHLGLRVVDTLTTSWGVRAGSTHVWFEMRP